MSVTLFALHENILYMHRNYVIPALAVLYSHFDFACESYLRKYMIDRNWNSSAALIWESISLSSIAIDSSQ